MVEKLGHGVQFAHDGLYEYAFQYASIRPASEKSAVRFQYAPESDHKRNVAIAKTDVRVEDIAGTYARLANRDPIAGIFGTAFHASHCRRRPGPEQQHRIRFPGTAESAGLWESCESRKAEFVHKPLLFCCAQS